MEVMKGLDWIWLVLSGQPSCRFTDCSRAAADCGYCRPHAEYMRKNSTEDLDPDEWVVSERFEPVEKR